MECSNRISFPGSEFVNLVKGRFSVITCLQNGKWFCIWESDPTRSTTRGTGVGADTSLHSVIKYVWEHCRETHRNPECYNRYRQMNEWNGKHSFSGDAISFFIFGGKEISCTGGFMVITQHSDRKWFECHGGDSIGDPTRGRGEKK